MTTLSPARGCEAAADAASEEFVKVSAAPSTTRTTLYRHKLWPYASYGLEVLAGRAGKWAAGAGFSKGRILLQA
jgi:hypothetical protein